MACEKESAIQQTPMPQLTTNWSPGLEHNLILDQYYQSHSVGDETSFEDKVGPQKTTGLPWYAKDATAAYLSVQVGLAGYAAALTGGWGGLGVI